MTDEILKDAELEQVSGGSGIECMAFLARLKAEGIYTPKTPLVVGNEAAAAKELQAYLNGFKYDDGVLAFGDRTQIYSDDRSNSYVRIASRSSSGSRNYETLSADQLVNFIRDWKSARG